MLELLWVIGLVPQGASPNPAFSPPLYFVLTEDPDVMELVQAILRQGERVGVPADMVTGEPADFLMGVN